MTPFLLDTHVLYWLALQPQLVPTRLRTQLSEAQVIKISAASAFEIAQKQRLGKLPYGDAILARWDELLNTLMAQELPLSSRDMMHAGSLTWQHRDPFDRMLVAQTQLNGLTLVTNDAQIHNFSGVSCAAWE